jgi:hypothetical protein
LEEFRTEDREEMEDPKTRKEFLVEEIIIRSLIRGLSVTPSLSSVSSVRALPPSDIFPSNNIKMQFQAQSDKRGA